MKTKAGMLLWLLALSILTAGCDSGRETGATSTTKSVIYRGNGGDPGSLDPALAEDIHAFNILTDLYEGLVAESATGGIVPGVAKSWTVSDDRLTYTFSLRNDARWSNGDPVTSDDFVKAFHRVADPAIASAYGFLLEPVQTVLGIDENTLQVSLARPTPHILAILSMPVAFPTPASAAEDSDSGTFVGNGAYVLAEHFVGGPTRLQRSPTYWDAASVAVDEIVYLPIVDPATEFNMYRAGELDITNTVPPEHVQSLEERIPDQLRVAPSLALYYLAFDLTEPPLDNGFLRQALNMAIDRQQLVSLIGRGEQAAFGIVPPGVAGHSGSQFQWRDLSDEERIRQARALYRRAGYSEKSPLSIKYTYDTGDIHEKIALAVSGMWRDVLGVGVTLEKMEWQYFLETRERRSEWQVMRFAWFGDYNHASTFTNIFRSEDPQNLSAFANPDYDRLLASASSKADMASRDALMAEAEAVLLADHPVAPLYFFVSKHLVRPGIGGFEPNVLDRHPSKYLFLEQYP
jgi:ABC-type oligopeptide transport system substrate-binding subunit